MCRHTDRYRYVRVGGKRYLIDSVSPNRDRSAPIPILLHSPILTTMALIGALSSTLLIFVFDIDILSKVKTTFFYK